MNNRYADIERWKKANPYTLLNVQNSQGSYGRRYSTLEDALKAAESYGGAIGAEGHQVLVSEMPCL